MRGLAICTSWPWDPTETWKQLCFKMGSSNWPVWCSQRFSNQKDPKRGKCQSYQSVGLGNQTPRVLRQLTWWIWLTSRSCGCDWFGSKGSQHLSPDDKQRHVRHLLVLNRDRHTGLRTFLRTSITLHTRKDRHTEPFERVEAHGMNCCTTSWHLLSVGSRKMKAKSCWRCAEAFCCTGLEVWTVIRNVEGSQKYSGQIMCVICKHNLTSGQPPLQVAQGMSWTDILGGAALTNDAWARLLFQIDLRLTEAYLEQTLPGQLEGEPLRGVSMESLSPGNQQCRQKRQPPSAEIGICRASFNRGKREQGGTRTTLAWRQRWR